MQVFIDGIRAQHFLLTGPRSSKTFVGFASRMGWSGGEKAFCFSMPRAVFEVNGQSNVQEVTDPLKVSLCVFSAFHGGGAALSPPQVRLIVLASPVAEFPCCVGSW